MEDAISRQAAIDAIAQYLGRHNPDGNYKQWKETAKIILEYTPSAQPERKMGRWVSLDDFRGKYNTIGYKCSECGEHSDYEENFCPNCGCQMSGGEQNGSLD